MQLQVMTQFLNKMGYPAHLPQVVIYAPIEVGGLGFHHLGYKQGVQHVLQLVKHLRSNTLNGQLYRALINAYQIWPIVPDQYSRVRNLFHGVQPDG